MASYLNKAEIRASLKLLINKYVEDCENCDKMSSEFINLIKHNFLAEYVVYDKTSKTVEIGIEIVDETSVYPEMKVYQFSLESADVWIADSCKEGNSDLEFYGQLINQDRSMTSSEVVVL